MTTTKPVTFERVASLASFGQGVIDVDVCTGCGAVVLRKQHDRHRRWHEQITQWLQGE